MVPCAGGLVCPLIERFPILLMRHTDSFDKANSSFFPRDELSVSLDAPFWGDA